MKKKKNNGPSQIIPALGLGLGLALTGPVHLMAADGYDGQDGEDGYSWNAGEDGQNGGDAVGLGNGGRGGKGGNIADIYYGSISNAGNGGNGGQGAAPDSLITPTADYAVSHDNTLVADDAGHGGDGGDGGSLGIGQWGSSGTKGATINNRPGDGGNGGLGGQGGIAVQINQELAFDNYGTLIGGIGGVSGNGGQGGIGGTGGPGSGDGGDSYSHGGRGGDGATGGAGGQAVAVEASEITMSNYGSVIGGVGNQGGQGGNGGAGGNGGDGGSKSITTGDVAVGGDSHSDGGDGGHGGTGGRGGDGIDVRASDFRLDNSGTVLGGDGGQGGQAGRGGQAGLSGLGGYFYGWDSVAQDYIELFGEPGSSYGSQGQKGNDGIGGDGGSGVHLGDSQAYVMNTGLIQGGNGGQSAVYGDDNGDPAPYGALSGQGGVGVEITGDSNHVVNVGNISGGYDYDRTQISNSVLISGDNNILEIRQGREDAIDYGFQGAVVSTGANNTLALGSADGETVAANRSFDVSTIGSSFTGFDLFEKTGASTWTLMKTGAAPADTPWRISGGVLSINSDDLLGTGGQPLTLNGGTLLTTASFSLNRPVSVNSETGGSIETADGVQTVLEGLLEGTGIGSRGLKKEGGGTLVITPDNPDFNLPVEVLDGQLNIGIFKDEGQARTGSIGDSSVTVHSGALLAVYGSVGRPGSQGGAVAVKSGGALEVGSGGTIYGDLRVDENGILHAASHNIALDVSGLTDLAGNDSSKIALRLAGGTWTQGTTYKLIQTADLDHLDGFTDQAVTTALVDYVIGRDEDDPSLLVLTIREMKEVSGGHGRPLTPNQRETAKGVDSLDKNGPVYQGLIDVAEKDLPHVLDLISGEIHASVAGSILHLGETFARQLESRTQSVFDWSDRMETWKSLWFNTGGSFADFDGNYNTSNGDLSAFEASVGYDAAHDDWAYGLAGRFSRMELDLNKRASEADFTTLMLAAYGGRQFRLENGKLRIAAGGAVAYSDISTVRRPLFAGVAERLTDDYKARSYNLYLTSSYRFQVGCESEFGLEPYLRFDYGKYRNRAIDESGGDYALHASRQNNEVFSGTVGLKGYHQLNKTTELKAGLGWRHRLKKNDADLDLAFKDSVEFNIRGFPLSRNAALVDFGLDSQVNDDFSIQLGLQGDFGTDMRRIAGTGTLTWTW